MKLSTNLLVIMPSCS